MPNIKIPQDVLNDYPDIAPEKLMRFAPLFPRLPMDLAFRQGKQDWYAYMKGAKVDIKPRNKK